MIIMELSYKNCYGLSEQKFVFTTADTWLSYKNCYGLSIALNAPKKNISMLSYKNCYGLSEHEVE